MANCEKFYTTDTRTFYLLSFIENCLIYNWHMHDTDTTMASIVWDHHSIDRMGPLCPRSYEATMPSIVWDHYVLDPMRPPCPRSYGTTVSSILWDHHALDRMGPLCPRSYETSMPSIVWDHCVLDPMRPPCPRSDESWSYIYHHQRLRMFDASSLRRTRLKL